jgi:anaerobic selenocysteine-containing dehydrogenase
MAATSGLGLCPLCEASCGIVVETDGERVLKIRGDARDPLSRGYLCPKAVALQDVQSDPNRIRTPLRRIGDVWHPIGWEEALDETATRLAETQRAHGPDSIAVYVGNPTAHDYAAILFGVGLLAVLRTKSFFSSNSVDGLPRLVASWLELGSPAALPVPDIERTDFLLMFGANPVVSNGSLMTAPDAKRRLASIRERGGQIVVIDPRRTETAQIADRHYFVRPGGDAFILAAMIRTILADRSPGERPASHLDTLVCGLDRIEGAVAPFSPERVAPAVGIPAGEIRELARSFASAKRAVAYGRIGTCTQEFGTLASWLIDVLNVVTGNFDREGGAMFDTPAADLLMLAAKYGARSGAVGFDRWRSRVTNLPEMNGEIPVAALADEIETPGPGQVRALLSHAGNPILSLPNGRRLERAISKLDFMVAIDIYKNETTRHAHLILPTTFGLEHDHYGLLPHMLAVRNFARYAKPLVPPPPGLRDSWALMLDLATRIWARKAFVGRLLARPLNAIMKRIGPRGVIGALLRFGPYGRGLLPWRRGLTLAQLEASPHGIDLGPLRPRLAELCRARGKPMEIAPERLLEDLVRLESRLESMNTDSSDRAALLLIGRRQLRSNNSWMHNSHRLVKGKPRCTLLMHPDDARSRGIEDGAVVRVESRTGAIEIEVELSMDMMTGVVSIPHGWGHDRPGVELDVARKHAGVSINDLTDEALVDPLSGCTSFSNVRITVAERTGPR